MFKSSPYTHFFYSLSRITHFFNYLGDDVNVSSKLLFLLFTEILWVIATINATFCMHYVIIFLPEEGRGKPIQW